MLWDRRCPDGGWNYGNRRVMGVDMSSFPETTALAILALRRSPRIDARQCAALLNAQMKAAQGRLARAWLTIALKAYGMTAPVLRETSVGEDVIVAALEAIAAGDGAFSIAGEA
jgi:hypothetical protein